MGVGGVGQTFYWSRWDWFCESRQDCLNFLQEQVEMRSGETFKYRSNFLWELAGLFRLTGGARDVGLVKFSLSASRIGPTFCGRGWDLLDFLLRWVGLLSSIYYNEGHLAT